MKLLWLRANHFPPSSLCFLFINRKNGGKRRSKLLLILIPAVVLYESVMHRDWCLGSVTSRGC